MKRRRRRVERTLDVPVALVDTPEILGQDQILQATVEIPDVLVRVVDLPVDVPDQDILQVGFLRQGCQ